MCTLNFLNGKEAQTVHMQYLSNAELKKFFIANLCYPVSWRRKTYEGNERRFLFLPKKKKIHLGQEF